MITYFFVGVAGSRLPLPLGVSQSFAARLPKFLCETSWTRISWETQVALDQEFRKYKIQVEI
jgi:hypothetical protein